MDIYLVRHGETDYNVAGRIQGGMDVPLNSTGLEQARRLGEKCVESGIYFDAILSSPKTRASKTAEVISDMLGQSYQELYGIEEIDLGDWQGLTWSEVKEHYKEDYKRWFHHRRYAR